MGLAAPFLVARRAWGMYIRRGNHPSRRIVQDSCTHRNRLGPSDSGYTMWAHACLTARAAYDLKEGGRRQSVGRPDQPHATCYWIPRKLTDWPWPGVIPAKKKSSKSLRTNWRQAFRGCELESTAGRATRVLRPTTARS
ncbi:hypothetical protein C2E23DRAFT_207817 [Lenzites betulinus]|nr:hypothetical protein C2E23DRAFT_207817 [Lenzites betulinus]